MKLSPMPMIVIIVLALPSFATVGQTKQEYVELYNTRVASDGYEEKEIWFATGVAMNTHSGSLGVWSLPILGRSGIALEWPRFYEIVGRHDLADSYKRTNRLRIGLGIGGGIAMLAGTVLTAYSFSAGDCRAYEIFDPDKCFMNDPDYTLTSLGIASILGGMVTTLVAIILDPNPISHYEAKGLADEYNKKLRQTVGQHFKKNESGRLSMMVTPALVPGGASMSLQVHF